LHAFCGLRSTNLDARQHRWEILATATVEKTNELLDEQLAKVARKA
jgi:hypothetical protein